MSTIDEKRDMMKSGFGIAVIDSDQRKGLPQPPSEKSVPTDAVLIDLPKPNRDIMTKPRLFDCIKDRKSRRKFTAESLALDELSYLLWATQGVREVMAGRGFRTVPSAGCRHPFDTYLAVSRVDGLEPGIYRYLGRHDLDCFSGRDFRVGGDTVQERVAVRRGSSARYASGRGTRMPEPVPSRGIFGVRHLRHRSFQANGHRRHVRAGRERGIRSVLCAGWESVGLPECCRAGGTRTFRPREGGFRWNSLK
mgnify:CR=1 FL=1